MRFGLNSKALNGARGIESIERQSEMLKAVFSGIWALV
jgi:hypothetical protein